MPQSPEAEYMVMDAPWIHWNRLFKDYCGLADIQPFPFEHVRQLANGASSVCGLVFGLIFNLYLHFVEHGCPLANGRTLMTVQRPTQTSRSCWIGNTQLGLSLLAGRLRQFLLFDLFMTFYQGPTNVR